ncbi:MAG: ABC transporter substrate-binding protein [Chitinophagaceae bacterium]
MPSFIDQTGKTIFLPSPPLRIISLVPSQTELLFDLGLQNQIAAITRFCVHPKEFYHLKPRVGGTKKLNLDSIHQLQPDLIIANKEENVREQGEECAIHYPVWVSDVKNLTDAYEMISQIGSITDKVVEASQMISTIKASFMQFSVQLHAVKKMNSCYLIWNNPYMTIGGDTFIHSMLEIAGFENAFKKESRYPEITIREMNEKNLEMLLLSSEPFPFNEKHKDELQVMLPQTKIILVDGEMFSWYGSRLVKSAAYFEKLLPQIRK